ncbi:MAG: BTAD domain-containing putative transcriptional regulator [Actinomycetota bacterium]
MEFLVLGPIEVCSAGTQIRVGGVKQRSILALLIANEGRAVSADRIVEGVYGEDAAADLRRSVQSFVSMLRRDLGDVIVGTGDGYALDAPREAVDAARFEDGVASGLGVLGDDPERASVLLGEALGLWRGDPYADVDGRAVFEPEIVRLNELRFTALEARVEADLACGRHRQFVGELEALTTEYPLRERLWGLLMLALYRVGRQADALGAYQRLRAVLGEELGIEPSTELRQLEEQILLQDPALDFVAPVPNNLPVSLTSFVGRRIELIEVGVLLADTRLVTLVGAGGSGKTRLGVEFARAAIGDFPDGVWFVDLRGADAGAVASLIASTLQVVTSGSTPVADQLVDALWSRRLLLILDNCEHALDGVAPVVERLMHRDGQVRVLATSREPLGVPGESMMSVHPLSLPELAGLRELGESEAAVLFAERAGSARPGFVVEEHVDAVFEICRTVEGLPLALELAAARLVVFSPEELADRLDDQLGTLKVPQKAGDLRHATIAATIRWSWDLLDDAERALLSRLSVFHGTWSLDAAESVCGFDVISEEQVVDLAAGLVDKSLVVVDRVIGGATRYRLLEPIRQFAARELDESTTDQLRSRFVDYWSATMAASYDSNSPVAVRDHERAKALDVDRANLTNAVEWALASGRFDDAMVIFGSPFGDLLMLQGSAVGLASRWMETALEHREEVPLRVLVCALETACSIASSDWQMEASLGYAELAIEASQTSEERYWFELSAAVAVNRMHRHDEADGMFDRIAAQARDPGLRASALLAKAQYAPPRQAWALSEAAMELSPIDSLGWWNEGRAAWLIGEAAAGSGRYDVAVEMEERSVELSRLSGWLIGESTSAVVLTWLYAISGRLVEASALIHDVVPLVRRIVGFHVTTPAALIRAADVARLQGDLSMARGYVDEVEQMAERLDGQWADIVEAEAIYEAALIARDDHDQAHAGELLDGLAEDLDVHGQASDPMSIQRVRIARASVELGRGDPDRALEDLKALLGDPERLFHIDALEAVDLTAIAFAQQGRAEQAARLKGAVDRERDDCGLVIYPPDALLRKTAMRHAQTVVEDDWDAFVQQGRAMSLEEALAHAAAEADAAREPSVDTNHADDGTVASA